MNARWVVGCDGIHSPTRDFSGIGFEGHDIAKPWAVFDATLKGWAQAFDMSFVYLDLVPVIQIGLPDRRWRIYMRPSSAESDLGARRAPLATHSQKNQRGRFMIGSSLVSLFSI